MPPSVNSPSSVSSSSKVNPLRVSVKPETDGKNHLRKPTRPSATSSSNSSSSTSSPSLLVREGGASKSAVHSSILCCTSSSLFVAHTSKSAAPKSDKSSCSVPTTSSASSSTTSSSGGSPSCVMGSGCSSSSSVGSASKVDYRISTIREVSSGVYEVMLLGGSICIPPLHVMTESDEVLVNCLSRHAAPKSFLTVFKAVLIMKTRMAARRANAEYSRGVVKRGQSRVALDFSLDVGDSESTYMDVDCVSDGHRRLSVSSNGSSSNRRDSASSCGSSGSSIRGISDGDNAEYRSHKSLMEERMAFLNCVVVTMKGDGNCQFRSAAWNLFGSEEWHAYVRHKTVEHMSKHKSQYEIFFADHEFKRYLKAMAQTGTWGDELCIRAIADTFNCTIHIITSTKDNWYLRYDPQEDDPDRLAQIANKPTHQQIHLFFTYISPIHYNAFMTDPNYNHQILDHHHNQ